MEGCGFGYNSVGWGGHLFSFSSVAVGFFYIFLVDSCMGRGDCIPLFVCRYGIVENLVNSHLNTQYDKSEIALTTYFYHILEKKKQKKNYYLSSFH